MHAFSEETRQISKEGLVAEQMAKIVVFEGPPFSGKTGRMIDELSKLDPFEYLFVGSKGEFVKFAGDFATERIGFINRSAFKTVDQFAVEEVERQTGMLFANKPLKLSILSSVIEEMGADDSDLPEELRGESYTIKRKSTVEKLLSFLDDVKTYMREEEFANAETMRDRFISETIRRLNGKFEKYGIFDTYDAYRMIADGRTEVSGKFLFIDGFYDFTPVVSKLFAKLADSFEKTFVTVTTGSVFADSQTILDAVGDFGAEKVRMKFAGNGIAKGLFFGKGEGVSLNRFERESDEVEWVARKIKKELMNGRKPKEMEIVVKSGTSDYMRLFKSKFDEYELPTVYLGEKRLAENTAVQQLMLALRVVTTGYPQDLLMSMVIAGFAGDHEEFDLVYDMAHLNRGALRLSHRQRFEDWSRRLDGFEEYLSRKGNLLSSEREDLVERSEMDEVARLETLTVNSRATISRLFGFLGIFEKARTPSEYSAAFEESIKVLKGSRPLSEDEIFAVKKFNSVIWEMENILNFMEIKTLQNSDYKYYIEMQFRDAAYGVPEDLGAIRISDILTSRFSHVPLKFFAGFTEGNYPSFQVNHFYNAIEDEKIFGTNRIAKRLRDDRLDFYLALSHSGEAHLNVPSSTPSGVPILPSLYAEDIAEAFAVEPKEPEAFPPMSRQEAIVGYARMLRWGKRDFGIEKRLGLRPNLPLSQTLADPENLAYCQKLAEKDVSFSRFETYERCPLKYFFSYVLKVPQRVVYDLDLNALELGIVYHNSLRRLLIDEGRRDELQRLGDSELRGRIEAVIREELGKISFFEADIFEINVLKLSDVVFNYIVRIELFEPEKRQKNLWKFKLNGEMDYFVPYRSEMSFGLDRLGKPAVELGGINFIGRIDRIDRCAEGVMIVDYKSKNAGEKDQLALYSSMYEKVFGGSVVRACFSVVEEPAIRNVLDSDKLSEMSGDVVSRVREFLAGVGRGEFPEGTKDGKCRNCDFLRLCPIGSR